MKNFLLILALSGVLLQNFTRVIIYVNFEINRDYIAKHYCINRDKPMSVCGGKCYLHKEFMNETKKEQSSPMQNIKSDRDILLFLVRTVAFTFIHNISAVRQFAPFKTDQLISFSSSVFHPPTI